MANGETQSRDGGFSLVEVLGAIVLMGIAITAILGGLRMAVAVSSRNADMAKVEAVLTSAADRLSAYAYLPCPADDPHGGYLPIAQAAAGAVDWDTSTVRIARIEYWEPGPGGSGAWRSTNGLSASECNAAVGLTTGRTLQKVTVVVTAPRATVSRSLEVVKSNVVPKPVLAA